MRNMLPRTVSASELFPHHSTCNFNFGPGEIGGKGDGLAFSDKAAVGGPVGMEVDGDGRGEC